jgi:UDP-N-acetylmuramoyl-L-alanyl-D-glutamate--2,6-diaminopimelate ligase
MLSAKEMSSATSRLVLLFGCGGDRDKTKRAVMGKIASSMASMTIITSDNSRGEKKESIIEDIMQGFDNTRDHVVIPDRREAIEFAIMNAGAGDVILLAGKGHEKYEIDTDGKHPFDERQIVRNALKKRAERYGQRE